MIFYKLGFFQMCVFAIVCLLNLIFLYSFVSCQIHFGKFYFLSCIMDVVLVKEVLISCFNGWFGFFGIRNVAFEAKLFNMYDTFDQIANKSMEDLGYAYLHCDLKHGSSNHNHSHKQITSYRYTWIVFVKMHVCEGRKFWHWIKFPKGIWERWHACCHYNWINDHYVTHHYFWTKVGSHVFPHGFH